MNVRLHRCAIYKYTLLLSFEYTGVVVSDAKAVRGIDAASVPFHSPWPSSFGLRFGKFESGPLDGLTTARCQSLLWCLK